MQEGGGENLALMGKDSLPRRRPGRTRLSYHKKVTSVARKGGGDSSLGKEPHRPEKCNEFHRRARKGATGKRERESRRSFPYPLKEQVAACYPEGTSTKRRAMCRRLHIRRRFSLSTRVPTGWWPTASSVILRLVLRGHGELIGPVVSSLVRACTLGVPLDLPPPHFLVALCRF